MTYDLQVFLFERPDENKLSKILNTLKLVKEESDPEEVDYRMMSVDTKEYLFLVTEVNDDFWDLAVKYANADGKQIVFEYAIEGAHVYAPQAMDFSKGVVDAAGGEGFVFDPQNDAFVYPRLIQLDPNE